MRIWITSLGTQIELCMNFMSSEFSSKTLVSIINSIPNSLMGLSDLVAMFKQCDLTYNSRFLNDTETTDDLRGDLLYVNIMILLN